MIIILLVLDSLPNLELDEYYEEDLMISNTTVVPHVDKWETVIDTVIELSEIALNNFTGNPHSEDY